MTLGLTQADSNTSISVLVQNPCSTQLSDAYLIGDVLGVAPPPETIYVAAQSYAGWGQDELLSEGDMSTGSWMLNHKGDRWMEYTDDFGQTWTEIRPDSNTGRVNMRMTRYSDGVWLVSSYKTDQHDYRLWTTSEPVQDLTGWNWIHLNALSYNRTHTYEDKTIYTVDGNNNSDDNLQKTTNWYPDHTQYVLETGNTATGTGPTNIWNSYVQNSFIMTAGSPQGAVSQSYTIWDKATLNFVALHSNVLFNGRSASQAGINGAIKSTGNIVEGGVSGSTVTVHTWGQFGVTTETATYAENVDYPCMHYENNQWFITCKPLVTADTMFITKGSSGSTYVEIPLPYPMSDYNTRSMRYIGNSEYLIAYLADVAAMTNVTTLIKVTIL
jgi:hypothetical protein